MERVIKYPRGSIWYAKLSEELKIDIGDRPVLIISSNMLNLTSNKVQVLAITSNTLQGSRYENVPFYNERSVENIISTSSSFSVSKNILTAYKGTATTSLMAEVEKALLYSLGMELPEEDISNCRYSELENLEETHNEEDVADVNIETDRPFDVNSVVINKSDIIEGNGLVDREDLIVFNRGIYNSLPTNKERKKYILDNLDKYTRKELSLITGKTTNSIANIKSYEKRGRSTIPR